MSIIGHGSQDQINQLSKTQHIMKRKIKQHGQGNELILSNLHLVLHVGLFFVCYLVSFFFNHVLKHLQKSDIDTFYDR